MSNITTGLTAISFKPYARTTNMNASSVSDWCHRWQVTTTSAGVSEVLSLLDAFITTV